MTAILTFGIAVYKGDLLDRLEAPLFKSLNMYQDNPTGSDADIKKKEAFKEVWNVIQTDMKCCGVLSADDWRQNVTQPDWDPASVVKPAGCCRNKKDDKGNIVEITEEVDILNCRRTVYSSESSDTYFFEGCLSKFKSQIVDNKEVIIWVAIAAVMILVVTLLITLAMCMKAD